ncbi:MAG: HEPN domain-containing protein [Nitrospirae bacterium]|nr:HEPN domain-containing protein [Nitrospirota bacterium]
MVERIGKEEGRLLAQDEFIRAMDELKAAKVLHESGFYYKSIASAYYAVYHSAKAALLMKGVVPQSHEGVERMFSLYYVKTKDVEIDIGKIIGRLMKLREEADYYPETSFTPDESNEAIEKAEIFVTKIKDIF